MNWAKENPFLAGLIAVSVVVLGGLGYFTYSNYVKYGELQAAYQTEVEKLHGLQNRSPFPSEENLQKIKDSESTFQQALVELSHSLDKYQLPLPAEVSPQQFQDELRKAVSQTQSNATEAGVKLPDDFYLGFDIYRASLPSQDATPQLARQLKAIEAIVNGLIETKIASISQLVRSALPVEGGAAAVKTPPQPNAPANNPAPKKLEKNLLDLTFSGEQGRMRMAVNSLLTSPQFLIVRALKIQNSAMTGPTKAIGTAEGNPMPRGPEAAVGSPEALNMLFGRETISAQVRVELIQFEKFSPAAPEKSK